LSDRIPRDLDTVCMKCLQKEPRKRYTSARELADDLRRFLAGEPVQARPVGRGVRAAKWVRRNPAVAGLLAAVVLVLLAGTVVSTFFAFAAAAQAKQARIHEAEARKNAEIAEQNAAELGQANAGLKKSRDELETTMARSLIRPLALQPGGLSEPE